MWFRLFFSIRFFFKCTAFFKPAMVGLEDASTANAQRGRTGALKHANRNKGSMKQKRTTTTTTMSGENRRGSWFYIIFFFLSIWAKPDEEEKTRASKNSQLCRFASPLLVPIGVAAIGGECCCVVGPPLSCCLLL